VERYLESANFRRWYQPLLKLLKQSHHTRTKQKILIYGIILHSLINTIDKKKLITRNRPGWANKLSAKSRRNLHFRIFKNYLPFVEKPSQYYKMGNRT
jgi:hypothetical protein